MSNWLEPSASPIVGDHTLTDHECTRFDITAGSADATLPPLVADSYCAVMIDGQADGNSVFVYSPAGGDPLETMNLDQQCTIWSCDGAEWHRVATEVPPEVLRPQLAPLRFTPAFLYALQSADVADTSGNGLTLTVAGAPTRGSVLAPSSGFGAFLGPALTGYFSCVNAAFALTAELSMGCVIEPLDPTASVQIVAQLGGLGTGGSAGNTVAGLRIVNQAIRYYHQSGSNVDQSLTGPKVLSPGRRHHIGFTRDNQSSQNIRLYVDGYECATGALSGTGGGGTNTRLLLGVGNSGVTPYTGTLGGVWGVAAELSAAQMLYMARLQLGAMAC